MSAPMRQNSGASRPQQRRRRRPTDRPAGPQSGRQPDAFGNPSSAHVPGTARAAAAAVLDDELVEDVSDHETDFITLGVPQGLVRALAAEGVTGAFPIQASTLPDSLAGRDLLGRGRTGSGKTIAFSLPLVARLAASARRRQPGRPRALVLVPTRELANQVAATIAPLARAADLRITTVYGGVGQGNQVNALRAGVDVVIACPGRLEDLIGQRHCHLDAVEITVLDEADHMADLGFLPVVRRLLDATPTTGQRLLFSANVAEIVIPGAEGDFAVLPGHSNLISTIRPGVIHILEGASVGAALTAPSSAGSGWNARRPPVPAAARPSSRRPRRGRSAARRGSPGAGPADWERCREWPAEARAGPRRPGGRGRCCPAGRGYRGGAAT